MSFWQGNGGLGICYCGTTQAENLQKRADFTGMEMPLRSRAKECWVNSYATAAGEDTSVW